MTPNFEYHSKQLSNYNGQPKGAKPDPSYHAVIDPELNPMGIIQPYLQDFVLGNRDWSQYAPLFRVAQRRVERKHYRQRLDLKNYDKQRQEMLQDLGADPYVD